MLLSQSNRFFWLLILLGALYSLVYVNQPASIDGDATLAVTQNFFANQMPTIEVIGASENLLPAMSRMGTWGVDGALYSKKGITPSLALLPLVMLANTLPDASVRALAMWFNPLVTLLTALMLYATARHLAVSSRHAFIGALLYGGATMALPYTQTLFGEPLAGLLLIVAVYAILRYNVDTYYTRWLVLAGFTLGATLGINYSYVVMIPFFALFLLYREERFQWRHWRVIILLVLPMLAWGGALLAYNMVRYGNPFTSGYNFAEGEGFTYPFLWGMFGLWLSPYRGVLWYNPILLWLPFVLRVLWRGHRALLLLVAGMALAQSLVYSAWWSWHGGIVWAPRFLVPLLPLLILLITLSFTTTLHRGWRSWALGALALVSVGVQALGTLIPYQAYYAFLYSQYGTFIPEGLVSGLQDDVMYTPSLSPIVGHFDLLRAWLAKPEDAPWQIAFLQANSLLHLALVLAFAGVGVMALALRRVRGVLVLGGMMMLGCLFAIALIQHKAPSLIARINTTLDAEVLVVAEQRIGNALMDVHGMYPISTNAPTAPDDNFTQALWQRALALADGQTLALVTWFAPASAEDWQSQALWRDYAYVDGGFLADATVGDDTRPRRYERFRLWTLTPDTPLDAVWGGQLGLEAYTVQGDAEGIGLALSWVSYAPAAVDFSFFVHVLDGNGQIIAQQDRQPQGGFAPTTQWGAMPIIDRLYFPLADATQARAIRIGWVDWRTGERLPLAMDANGDTGIGDTGIGDTGIGDTGIGDAGIGDAGITEENALIVPVGE